MKEQEKNMEAIDNLFRHSLERYSPAPPPDLESALMQKITFKPSVWDKLINYLNLNTFIIAASVVAVATILYFILNEQPEQNTLINKSTETILTPEISKESQTRNTSIEPVGEKADISKLKSGKAAAKKEVKVIPDLKQSSVVTNNQLSGNKESLNETVINEPVEVSENTTNPETQNKTQLLTDKAESVSVGQVNNDISDNIKKSETPDPFIEPVSPKSDGKERVNSTDVSNPIGNTTGDMNPIDKKSGGRNKIRKSKNELFGYNIALLPTFGGVFQKSRETNLFYGFQVNGGIKYKPLKLGFETGIGYEKYTDRGSYDFTYRLSDTISTYYDTTWIQLDSTWYMEINTTYDIDTGFLNHTEKTRLTYSYIALPFYITKQIYENNIFRFGIKTGVNAIFLSTKTEPVPTYHSALGSFEKLSNNNYSRNSLLWQFVVSPQFLLRLNKKLYFQIEPAYRIFINELYTGSNKPEGKPNPFSINTGIRIEW